MPILILVLSAIGGAVWWWIRQNPRQALNTADDLITTAINAPRRLAFRRDTNQHPVEGIDDPRIAVAAIAEAFLESDDLPTKEGRDRLHVLLRSRLRLDPEEALEMQTLGRWLVQQCNGPEQAANLLARRLQKLDGNQSWGTLSDILSDLGGTDGLSGSRKDMAEDLARTFAGR